MDHRFHDLALKILKIIDVLLITAPFAVCWMCHYGHGIASPYYAKGDYLIIALFLVLYAIYAQIYDALLVSMSRISEMVYSQGLSAFLADAIIYFVCWLLTKHLPTLWPILLVFAVQLLLSVLWSCFVQHWYFRQFAPKKTAIVYDMRAGMEDLVQEYRLDSKFDICVNISAEQCIQERMAKIGDCEVIFLCGVHSHDRNIILKYCIAHSITVYVIPRIGDVLMDSAKRMHMFHLPILQVRRYHPSLEFLAAKRLMDILISGISLVILSPVILVTAIAIKATDRGPVFYRQCRLTKNGKKFDILKFRSMCVDAEKDGVARLSTGDADDRITPVGKVIRSVRIDELPQLFNILKGDMSIVGPRPERPEIAEQYQQELPEFALRLQTKAGLTGYAQIYGKYNTTPYDKLQMDLMYIAKPSILEDLRIMFATVKILFLPESTEGIAEGQETAMESEEGVEHDFQDTETIEKAIMEGIGKNVEGVMK